MREEGRSGWLGGRLSPDWVLRPSLPAFPGGGVSTLYEGSKLSGKVREALSARALDMQLGSLQVPRPFLLPLPLVNQIAKVACFI